MTNRCMDTSYIVACDNNMIVKEHTFAINEKSSAVDQPSRPTIGHCWQIRCHETTGRILANKIGSHVASMIAYDFKTKPSTYLDG